jgi:hypothetical protein
MSIRMKIADDRLEPSGSGATAGRVRSWLSLAVATVALAVALGVTAHASTVSTGNAGLTFTPLTLQNGWTASPFGTRAPAVAVDSAHIVHFKGAIATTGTNPVPFTLPAAFRPSGVVFVAVDMCNATNGRLQIEPTGVVTVQAEGGAFSNAACFTSLDGVTSRSDATGTAMAGWARLRDG